MEVMNSLGKRKSVNTYDDHYRNLTQKHYVGYYGVPRFSKNEAVEESADVYSDYLDSSLGDVIRIDDATNLVLEKRWRYDDRGNVVSEKKRLPMVPRNLQVTLTPTIVTGVTC